MSARKNEAETPTPESELNFQVDRLPGGQFVAGQCGNFAGFSCGVGSVRRVLSPMPLSLISHPMFDS